MKIRRSATHFCYSVIALLMSVCPLQVVAQDAHSHMQAGEHQQLTPAQKGKAGALIKAVREATARFQDVSVAQAEGYALQFGCVSGGDVGAMGMHFINGNLVASGVIDAAHPQIVLYEPMPNGGVRLTGADYLVLVDTWNTMHPGASPPELMGQLFHLFDAPNRFGLPPFYTLHVWAWRENPNGAFVNWNPSVSCEAFGGE